MPSAFPSEFVLTQWYVPTSDGENFLTMSFIVPRKPTRSSVMPYFGLNKTFFELAVLADKKRWREGRRRKQNSYPSRSISGRGCPESELIPPMNPFGGTRPPSSAEEKFFFWRYQNSFFFASLWKREELKLTFQPVWDRRWGSLHLTF